MCKDIYNDMLYIYIYIYIYWALFYEMKKGGSFSTLDEELLVYMDLINKT
jgi:hypothetical protein